MQMEWNLHYLFTESEMALKADNITKKLTAHGSVTMSHIIDHAALCY